jgi:cyclopropane-fatty-acyl-phospholipid synthase
MSAASATAPAKPRAGFEIVPVDLKPGSVARLDPYSAAIAYIRGRIDVRGDLVEAVRFHLSRTSREWRRRAVDALCRWVPWHLAQFWESRSQTARDIRFHYDRSNQFYRQFLDSRMVYSCAYFRSPSDSLEEAQLAKLEHICRKLRMRAGDRFLDIGCGWGGLILHAAEKYRASAVGCTLSRRQAEYAAEEIRRRSLERLVRVREADYRDQTGEFDKIASVGMFEHVGRHRLEAYFRKLHSLLAPHGLLLNHGISSPEWVRPDAQTRFIARNIFPNGEILHLGFVIAAAERAGLEVLDVECLRRHYALTCRAWVERLRSRREACLATVDQETWRTWQLYLAGSAVAFEEGNLAVHQVLLAKTGSSAVPLTRD